MRTLAVLTVMPSRLQRVCICLYLCVASAPQRVPGPFRGDCNVKILLFLLAFSTAGTLRERRNSDAGNSDEVSAYTCTGQEVRWDMTEGAETPKD